MAIGAFQEDAFQPAFQQLGTTVPDVVGELQADGTTTLEGAGFAVSVATAYSSTVPAGEIISQSPAGGDSAAPGSAVTITVSLGEAPVPPVPDGGGGGDRSDSPEYWYWLERARNELKRQAEQRLAIRQDAERIADQTDREISTLLRKQQAKDESRKELAALQKFADAAVTLPAPSARLGELVQQAATAKTNTALLQLQRELAKMDEEEEALVMTLLLLQ